MKQALLPMLVATALMGASSITHAETWECAIIGATQKVILTQESDPALSDNRYVPGTVTGPYGMKHTAEVSIDGFDRRWDYVTADKIGVYAVFMGPSGLTGFYDFSNPEEEVGTRLPEHHLFCEESKAKAEKRLLAEEDQKRKQEELKAQPEAEESQRRLNSPHDAYRLAIKQKIERNWRRPQESGKCLIVRSRFCRVSVGSYSMLHSVPVPEEPTTIEHR